MVFFSEIIHVHIKVTEIKHLKPCKQLFGYFPHPSGGGGDGGGLVYTIHTLLSL